MPVTRVPAHLGMVTADQAAAILHVPARKIRTWHRTGLVAADGAVPGRGTKRAVALFYLDVLQGEADRYHADPRTPACMWCGTARRHDTPPDP